MISFAPLARPLAPSICTIGFIAPRTASSSSPPSFAVETTNESLRANSCQSSSRTSRRPNSSSAARTLARKSSSLPGEWRPEPMMRKSSGIRPAA
jgi:hypothetical protein